MGSVPQVGAADNAGADEAAAVGCALPLPGAAHAAARLPPRMTTIATRLRRE
ncbi:hypothetical protein Hesp01_41190 [Herbidospora sp. NBRC 101105]|nr:hypothetical protein Hesp01_41190 [Herbidospora sp. NBRC 101105]